MKIALVFCRIDNLFDKCSAGVFSMFESNPPLGLGAIGTAAKRRGHEVKIFDQLLHDYSNDEMIEWIRNFSPDMIGFSCTSLNIENSIICGSSLKEKLNCIIFAGGIHITLCAEKVMNKQVFDFLISGEGEEVFEAVLNDIENGVSLDRILVKGFIREGVSKDCDCYAAILKTINQPVIDRGIFEINLYKNKGALLEETPCYSLFSSRGCPYMCKFCSKPDYFKIYRQRDVEGVIEEIDVLIKEFGAKAISFREDNFTVDHKRLRMFCNTMIEKYNGTVFWECESRADMPTELLQLMYDAGCRGIWCGVETIVPKWSEWINKGLQKENVIKFYDDCKNIGIKTGALFMFGFPEQTDEEIEEDVNFAISLPTEFSAFQCLAIFPGSPLEEYYKEHEDLKYTVTEGVSLALTKGFSYQEMIAKERDINIRIKSNRLAK